MQRKVRRAKTQKEKEEAKRKSEDAGEKTARREKEKNGN